jgi:Coenzyme PQQ synthesis protein D (PqqD)
MMSEEDLEMQCYVRSDSVVSRVIAGETLIIPVRKGVGDLASIYSLNEVASFIWQMIEQPRPKHEIVQYTEQSFAGHRDEIEHDVEAFLGEMHSVGLVSAVSVGAPA